MRQEPKNEKERLEVLQSMSAHAQFCMSGDHTLSATVQAINELSQVSFLIYSRFHCYWTTNTESGLLTNKAFHRFGQTKFPNDGSVLGSSKFSILPHEQLPLKTMLDLKVVKIDPKIIISLC